MCRDAFLCVSWFIVDDLFVGVPSVMCFSYEMMRPVCRYALCCIVQLSGDEACLWRCLVLYVVVVRKPVCGDALSHVLQL